METFIHKSIAIVGVGAVLPDAPDAPTFWSNIQAGRYSVTEVPTERWNPELYYDPDPEAPDKTYSKIGGWVRDWKWDPLGWRLPIPPRVSDAMDHTQKWAILGAKQALEDYGYPERPLDPARTAVILGSAMAGDLHYMTSLRIFFPEYAEELASAPSFDKLDAATRRAVVEELRAGIGRRLPEITEDTMPGELANIIAGRVANVFDFHGPNYVTDAACASAMAAFHAAIEGLEEYDFDAVVTGGIDANMSASCFTKFCKIGALSATGTRPYGDGADGFVMGEGAAVFVLKRLEDAERDGDRIYALVRGVGGSSDGRGKGITAPNPVGQKYAVERGWANAARMPGPTTMIEGHGTSTKVGDVVEVASLTEAFKGLGLPPGSIPLGSVKSNIGHLKGASGAAGILKAAYALHDKVLPPSLGAGTLNPKIDFAHSPFYVNRELRPWETGNGEPRRAGVSAFGFGGTNFHIVLEEYVPGYSSGRSRHQVSVGEIAEAPSGSSVAVKAPPRGILLLGAESEAALAERLRKAHDDAREGRAPEIGPPRNEELLSPERVTIDYGDAGELASKTARAAKALESGRGAAWAPLGSQGIFRGRGTPGKVAFLYTGQGSQYVNMLRDLREKEPVVASTFAEADSTMAPLLGRALTDFIFADPADKAAMEEAGQRLRQTEVTQPAVLTVDIALTRLLASYGLVPDMVMGHSLGEYGALVAAGVVDFSHALQAVSLRGHAMAKIAVDDNGTLAAVTAPLEVIERTLEAVDGHVVVANYNSTRQAVIGGASEAVAKAIAAFGEAGHDARPLAVSHAFHTEIVAPAEGPLVRMLRRFQLRRPTLPIISNVTGDFYPQGEGARDRMIELLGRQISSPVRFVDGLESLYGAGARIFVEVGPKRALTGFVQDVLGSRDGVSALSTNHPRLGDVTSFNHALCGFYAAGLGPTRSLERTPERQAPAPRPEPRRTEPTTDERPVVVTGAALGLPGYRRFFDERNVQRILAGEQFIDFIPNRFRQAMLDKNVTRLVKDDGNPRFETITSAADVIKLAGRAGSFDLVEEFGFPAERREALDVTTELAIGAGIDALRDAGIPLVMHYKTTSKGTLLPERWMLPDELRDSTGVIFASAFPGVDYFAKETERYYTWRARRERLSELEDLRTRLDGSPTLAAELDQRIAMLRDEMRREAYTFDRRFLFRLLSMGHSQFAEYIGARGPNTQVNSACASTTQALALAEDWIRLGRARRVVVISADDVTSDHLMEWIGAGFLASGAAATDDAVEDAAVPFDRRRHGMLVGMGAAALVLEEASASEERGLRPICEILASETRNSAFHGTRLDVEHICGVMEDLVSSAESRWGIRRSEIAPQTVFVSHETYTPARGGSAAAEVHALRRVFGDDAEKIVIANTKGFTGHPMAVGIEDVVAVKTLETGIVPPVPNFKEVDPELGTLNLSVGGPYPVTYALRLAAGFGSQISLSLARWVPTPDGRRPVPGRLGYASRLADPAAWQSWLDRVGNQDPAELEVDHRTLRIKDRAVAREKADARIVSVPVQPEPEPARPAPPPVAQAAVPVKKPEPVVETPTETASEDDAVRKKVLEIVAEKTGYPPDMLDLDLDLEADLGVDTVKQAETFAAIREAYDIPRDENLSLADYPTLAHAIEFVYTHRPDLKASGPPDAEEEIPPNPPLSKGGTSEESGQSRILPPFSKGGLGGFEPERAEPAPEVPRRVPTPLLRPPTHLCKSTGVHLEPGRRVVLMPDQGGVGRALAARLEKLGVDVLTIDGATANAVVDQLAQWTSDGPIHGVYWLPALDDEGDLADMDAATWRETLHLRVKLLYTTMRTLYDAVSGEGTFLVSATRLGGLHGYGDDGASAPLGGAVTGFTKTYKRERPDALVKAVDFAPSRRTAALADLLVEETLRDPGAVEVGYRDDLRWTVGLVERPSAGEEKLTLDADTVYVVTGAAGSIVSAIVTDLARSGGTFHLLDLAPEPDPRNPDLVRFESDRDGLKRDLFERMRDRGERATPAKVEKQLTALERQQAALRAVEAVRRSGGEAFYHQVDLLDEDAVAAAVGGIRERHGRVDVLVHAAGLEISHNLPDKEPREFDLVFDVKADGYFHVLRALGDLPLRSTVSFTSIAGRFGNAGQTDYSSANDLLCKLASSFRKSRPETRAIAIDWTAWGGIGMATRGSIPKMMELAGIDMLPPEAGIPVVRREILKGGGEVVVAQGLGQLLEEFDPTGGLDPDAFPGTFLARDVRAMGLYSGLTVETTLDPKEQPFLYDHRIEGTPVLPGVMGIEAFAQAARLLVPERHVAAVEDIDFLAPFKYYRGEPRTLRVEARLRPEGGDLVADCRLIGVRRLTGRDEPQMTTHFTARVRLTSSPPAEETRPRPGEDAAAVLGPDEIYRVYFHGPAYQVIEKAWRDNGIVVGRLPRSLPADQLPDDTPSLMEPRLIELCFQTAGLWEIGQTGKMGLPSHVARVSRPGVREAVGRLCAVVERSPENGGFTARVLDEAGHVLLALDGYSTVELPGSVTQEDRESFRQVLS